MKSDIELQKEILNELKWEPGVKVEKVGVHIDSGVVHLTGEVDSYPEKMAVERAVKRVPGVTAIAQEMKVRLLDEYERNDEDMAGLIGNALEWNVSVPHDDVKVTVQDGWVMLDGTVDFWYQRNAAEEAVRNMVGVKGVTNRVLVKPSPTPQNLKEQIERNMVRVARLDARQVEVEVTSGKAILTGTVSTVAERDEAERAVCTAPGISEIENKIKVKAPAKMKAG